MPAVPITIKLAEDRSIAIAFGNDAIFRMQRDLPRAFEIADLSRTDVGYAALVSWLWAMLTEEHQAQYPKPEALLPYVPPGVDKAGRARRIELVKSVVEAINASEPKNGDGSTPRRSRRSS